MKRLLLLLLLGFSFCFSQVPVWQWAVNPSQVLNYWGTGIKTTVDPFGNVFLLSDSRGAAASPSITADSGVYLARYSQSGLLLWCKHLEGYPSSVCADQKGNVFVGGTKYHYNTTPTVTTGAYITKIDAHGNTVWENDYKNRFSAITSLTVGPSGRLFVTGYKADTLLMGSVMVAGAHPLFVARLTEGGITEWAKSGEVVPDTSGSYKGSGNTVTLDEYENVFVTYKTSTCPNWSCLQGWLLKLDKDGNYLLNKYLTDYNGDCRGLVIQPGGDIVMTLCASAWTSGGSFALRRYKADLSSYYWSRTVAAWQCKSLCIDSKPVSDPSGFIYITGSAGSQCGPYKYKLGFGSDTIMTDSLEDIVVCKLNAQTGDFVKVWHLPGRLYDHASDISVDRFGNCYVSGVFNGSYSGSQEPNDTLCFGTHCLTGGSKNYQLFLAKLRLSEMEFTDYAGLPHDQAPKLLLSPNPSSGIFQVSGNVPFSGEYRVYDISGMLVIKGQLYNSQFDLSACNDGIYIVEVNENNRSLHAKVVLQK
jgi:hypothetical protein